VTRATLPGGRIPLGIDTTTGAPVALLGAGGPEADAAWLALGGAPAFDGLATTGSDPEADTGGCDPHAASRMQRVVKAVVIGADGCRS
jgi:hypothetical protein